MKITQKYQNMLEFWRPEYKYGRIPEHKNSILRSLLRPRKWNFIKYQLPLSTA